MHDFLTWLSAGKSQAVIGGALGGLVRWLSLRTNLTDGIIAIVVGAICAVYLGPLAQPIINVVLGQIVLDADARQSLAGFIIGLGGISVSGTVMDYWASRRRRASKEDDDADDDGGAPKHE